MAGITLNVFLAGLVSFLTDAASEMIFPLLPIFLALPGVAGGFPVADLVGLLEGAAETAAALCKLGAGMMSDRARRKKPFILAGYGLSSAARPLMALAATWWHPVLVRLVDRFGKGIRTAPRDALIAESTPPAHRGKAFGFHRSMDHLGAVLGPLLAVALLLALHRASPGTTDREGLLRAVFLFSAIPGAATVAIIAFWLRDVRTGSAGARARLSWKGFDANFRRYLGCIFLFTLGNSTDMFLILRAAETIGAGRGPWSAGVRAMALVPLLWAFFHVFKMVSATPFASLSDRIGRKKLIGLGWGVYILSYAGFALMNRAWQAWPLFALYAMYYGLTEGVERALVADLAPPHLVGTAMGLYHLAVGLAALPASLGFGLIYASLGPPVAFGCAAFLALAASFLLLAGVGERRA
ncbi:MAG: MFS transporter [Patescibacteria group bacterium]